MTAATFSQASLIDPSPFVRRDSTGASTLELAVKGMRCAGCIAKIERGVSALADVLEARVNLSMAKLNVRWREGRTTADAIVARVNHLGFEAFPYDPEAMLRQSDEEGQFLLSCLAVAGFAASNVMFLSISIWAGFDGEMGEGTRTMLHWISGLIAVPAALYSGRPFFRSALSSVARGQANMDVPISLGIVLALGLSISETVLGGRHAYFDAAISLPFLLLIGRYLDYVLRRKAQATARDLIAMQTTTATRLEPDGRTVAVAPKDIGLGERLLISPGERVPVDGVVESGSALTDLSLVTGESAPTSCNVGDELRAGSLIVDGAVTLCTTARVQESLVAEIMRLLEAGQQNRSRYVRLADRAARLYVPLVHGAAAIVFLGGMMWGVEVRAALTNAIALLIITCPCALGLAVPAVQIVATNRLFRRGLLVKSGDALERLAEVTTVVFDKTGTLTLGRPVLVNKATVSTPVLERAATMARASKHPLARAMAAAAGTGRAALDVREIPGEGLESTGNGRRARLGRAAWVGAEDEAGPAASHIWYREGDEPAVRFDFQDRLRNDAQSAVAALKARGLHVQMLSGDRDAPALKIARECGIEVWKASSDPKAKVSHLNALREVGAHTLMIGDGLNDAAALSMAHVSMSPSSAADASQAAADMVLTTESLGVIAEAIDVARAARGRVLENFAFAALYNVLAVPLAAFGQITPLIAATAMSASSLIVMLNALRISGRR